MWFVRDLFAAPQNCTGILRQRDDRTLRASGRDDDLVAIDERPFGETPFRKLASEILAVIFAPFLGATLGLETTELAVLSHGIEKLAVDSGRNSRTFEVSPPDRTGFSELGRPGWRAILFFQGDDKTGGCSIADFVDVAIGHREGRITFAQARHFPGERRAGWGPILEQAGFLRGAIPVRAPELGPVIGVGGNRKRQQ